MQEVSKKLFGAMIEDIGISESLNESNYKQTKHFKAQIVLMQTQTQNEFNQIGIIQVAI